MSTEKTTAAQSANALLRGDIGNDEIPEAHFSKILEVFAKHTKTMASFKKFAQTELEKGNVEIDGWFLKPGAQTRTFTPKQNPHLFTVLARDYGCTADRFREATSVSVTEVGKIIKEHLPPGTSAEAINLKVNDLVNKFGETKQNNPSLKPLPTK